MTNHRTHPEPRSDAMAGPGRGRQGAAVADTIGHFARAGRAVVVAAVAALPILVAAAPAPKEPPHEPVVPTQCAVPDDTAMIDGPLPRLARRMKAADPLTIVVIGSGSAAGSGTSRKEAAFPYRLEARFQKVFNKPKTRLVVLAEMGQTAPVMYTRLAKDVIPLKPALVVWQTGSADAARGTPVMEFGTALEHGIAELRDHGSDVLLIDSQFSPRASLLVNTDSYREAVRWNARRFDLPLFKRYDTMQYWWSHDVFDLDAEGKANQLDNADHIHDCVAALLVRAIQRGIAAGGKS
jgi:acyl-CoA thioesterase-1